MPHPIDGGRRDRPRLRPESPDALPCENDQAKPDRFSRLARSTLLSKILTTLRLSGAVWIEAQSVKTECPRTCCAYQIHACRRALAFLREPSNPIEVPISCQGGILWESSLQIPLQSGTIATQFPIEASICLASQNSFAKAAHSANSQRATDIKCLAPQRRTKGRTFRVMQWVCSLRDSLQGSGERLTLPCSTLRTGFPLPTRGRP